MKKNIFLFVGLLLLIFSCDEKDEVYPKIELEITPTFASSFLARGNITVIGSSPVVDYGFVYSTFSNPDIFQATKIGMGTTAASGPFEKNISIPFPGQPTIYVRTFLTNERGTVYGGVKEFSLPILTAASVAPLKAKAGDQITLTGINFNPVAIENTVKFNDREATVLSATSTTLIVEVPEGITDPVYYENITIRVTTGGQEVTATQNFKILPTILDFSPSSGTFGTTVVLSGRDFAPVSQIKIGGEAASVFNISYNSIAFNIPPTVTAAKLKISLEMGTEVIAVPGEFTITPPTITSVTPLVGLGGSRVQIIGTGFNIGDYLFSYNVIKFGTVQALAFNASINEIIAFVPPGLSAGTYKVSVFTGVHTVVYGPNYTVTIPTLTSFSPTSGVAGTYVTITGTNFGEFNPSHTVLFGSALADIYTWNDTSIIVMIPVGTGPGPVKITLNIAGQSVTSAGNYTILP